MNKKVALLALISLSSVSFIQNARAADLDLGPLINLIGIWESTKFGGVDVAPGQAGSNVGKGGPAVEPYYETITFEPAADATNASEQYLTALYYKQEVFRKRDNGKFHDQRGYLIYDKKNQMVYNSFCIPRAVCVVAEGKAGQVINFESSTRGVAESKFMTEKDTTTKFKMSLDMSEKDILKYSQITSLEVYGGAFTHTDSGTFKRKNEQTPKS
ncbi:MULTISPECIES: heme-binding beta-barrel domain-containing protein [unclassified Moritella]|uniref:heme-binding beta-barrel domain-containing protein n=1 Tax=unclassified Moritella TaxID=2637987 RepID=UPI001BA6B9FC|nr:MULTISPECIES: heme-binding beta-barrel domain-containing protein [unclassified Moritella]QUM86785.1 FABP family protein [Moritella sp. 28]QUM91012.1 FABP family protein [Moritella sp. 36]